MRTARLFLLAAFAATPILADNALANDSRVRPATETEIRDTLAKSSELKDGTNGYQYRSGSQIGYKITDGKICVLQRRKTSCVSVYSDGKRLETIDRRGNRDFLN
jgi:hypothetical protein